MSASPIKPQKKSREEYPAQENAWLNKIVADYAIWCSLGGQAYDFIELVVKELFRRFPYRDPRAIDHYPHTAEEDEEVLYGRRLRLFLERLRHKLNTLKRFKFGVVPPPSGCIELYETLKSLQNRLQGEVFLHAGTTSPYSRDLDLEDRTQRFAARMELWPEIDYGACREDERRRHVFRIWIHTALTTMLRVCRDIPGDCQEWVNIMAAKTGAEFLVISSWKNDQGTLMLSGAASDMSRGFLSQDAYSQVKQMWANYQSLNNKAADAESIDDRLVHPDRLPEDWTYMPDPDGWTNAMHIAFARKIYADQHGITPGPERFQFLGSKRLRDDVTLVETIADGSSIRYDLYLRMYVARILKPAYDDRQVLLELRNMLPVELEQNLYTPFPPAAQQLIVEATNDHSGPRGVMFDLDDYEACYPVQAKSPLWTSVLQTIRVFPLDAGLPPGDVALNFWGNKTWPAAPCFDREAALHVHYHPTGLLRWLKEDILTHKPTRTAFGGPYGIKMPFLALVRFAQASMRIKQGELPPYADFNIDMQDFDRAVNEATEYMRIQIEHSAARLMALRGIQDTTVPSIPHMGPYHQAQPLNPAPIVSFAQWFPSPENSESCDKDAGTRSRPSTSASASNLAKPSLNRVRFEIVLPRCADIQSSKGKQKADNAHELDLDLDEEQDMLKSRADQIAQDAALAEQLQRHLSSDELFVPSDSDEDMHDAEYTPAGPRRGSNTGRTSKRIKR
ncbi:hypothetical protein RhiJN_27077 [Ceratobasidium sp. AG-Ba]|nr:hypothetical protein RhiJN_27077 [Ceratobasidium sp. AG-Ba]